MANPNRLFIYGICVASIVCSLYALFLLRKLNQSENLSKPFITPKFPESRSRVRSNNVLDEDEINARKESYEEVLKNPYKSQMLINKMQMHDVPGPGPLDELGLLQTDADLNIRNEGYQKHAFNTLVSNRLSMHRNVTDTRNKLCMKQHYNRKTLPNASVIICFYNEHNMTLLRSIHSIFDRTPPNLLHEIILINDFSNTLGLHEQINDYIKKNFDDKVKLFKTERREGLIRARIFGARKASGKVIVFLDSHIEVNVDWLQPLLARIKEDSTNVVLPIIDVINADTFNYTSSPLVRGGFNWGLHFKWENLPVGTLVKDEDFIKPIKSPTMAGGLFAIDRKYFYNLGEYDAGMNIWGGENLEISFRIWMCGGSLHIIPCSRVGHVFRQKRPYNSPDGQDTMLYNSLRLAHVWMDDYKENFLKSSPTASKTKYGDISSRLQLRKDLNCKNFSWYLKNVYPEMTLPTDDDKRLKKKWAALEQDKFQPWHLRKRNYIKHFQIRLSKSSLCMQSSKDVKTKGSALVLRPCMRSKTQMWYETDKNELVLAQLLCLQANQPEALIYKCHEMGGDQEWKHKGENQSPIYNMASGTCLGVRNAKVGATISMTLCNDPVLNKWDLVEA